LIVTIEFDEYMQKLKEKQNLIYCKKTEMTKDIAQISKKLPKMTEDIQKIRAEMMSQANSNIKMQVEFEEVLKKVGGKLDVSFQTEILEKLKGYCSYNEVMNNYQKSGRSPSLLI